VAWDHGPPVNDAAKNPYQWFKDFQPPVAAILAAVGLYVAWRNVSRQVGQAGETMLINLMAREEWIEKDLPVLELTANFLGKINLAPNSTPEYLDIFDENLGAVFKRDSQI
jgi:hypothetical protein